MTEEHQHQLGTSRLIFLPPFFSKSVFAPILSCSVVSLNVYSSLHKKHSGVNESSHLESYYKVLVYSVVETLLGQFNYFLVWLNIYF